MYFVGETCSNYPTFPAFSSTARRVHVLEVVVIDFFGWICIYVTKIAPILENLKLVCAAISGYISYME